MHTADSKAAENTADNNSPPGNGIIGADCEKGDQQDEDRDEEGYSCEPPRVGYLHLGFSVGKIDGSVSNEMLVGRTDGEHSRTT